MVEKRVVNELHLCSSCNSPFNMTEKMPVVVPWGDTICDECYTALDDPQNKDVLICPQDGEEYPKPNKKIYNKKIVSSLE